MTLAVPLAGLLALAAEQLVASLGGLRKRGPYNSPLSITLLPTQALGDGTNGLGLGTDPRCGLLGMQLSSCFLLKLLLLEECFLSP